MSDTGGIYVLDSVNIGTLPNFPRYNGYFISSYLSTVNNWSFSAYSDGHAIGNCTTTKRYAIAKWATTNFRMQGDSAIFLYPEYNYKLSEVTMNSNTISCIIPQRVFFAHFGVLYFFSGNDTIAYSSLSSQLFDVLTEQMTNNLMVERVTAAKNRPPWIIASGKIYKSSCNPPYENFEESSLCVLTCPSHFTLDTVNKVCKNCRSDYKFYIGDSDCIYLTNSLCSDIPNAINGNYNLYIYILKF